MLPLTPQEAVERQRKWVREAGRLKRLSKHCAADPNRVLLSSKLHGLVELATAGGATNHERRAARAALRKRGLL